MGAIISEEDVEETEILVLCFWWGTPLSSLHGRWSEQHSIDFGLGYVKVTFHHGDKYNENNLKCGKRCPGSGFQRSHSVDRLYGFGPEVKQTF